MLENCTAAREPALFASGPGRHTVEPRQRGVVAFQPQLELDRFELQSDDWAKSSEPLVEAAQGANDVTRIGAEDGVGAFNVEIGRGPKIQSLREVDRRLSRERELCVGATPNDQRVSMSGLTSQKAGGRVDGGSMVARLEKHVRPSQVDGRDCGIEVRRTIEIVERLLPLTRESIELRAPDEQTWVGRIARNLRRDGDDLFGKSVVPLWEMLRENQRHRQCQEPAPAPDTWSQESVRMRTRHVTGIIARLPRSSDTTSGEVRWLARGEAGRFTVQGAGAVVAAFQRSTIDAVVMVSVFLNPGTGAFE